MLFLQFIIVQTVIFGIVIFVLKKIMVGSTDSAVNRLNESYEEMEQKKEELAGMIKEAERDYKKKKQEAEVIANEIKEKNETEVKEYKDETMKKAREEAERLIAETVKATESIRDEIRKEEQVRMVDYCEELFSGVFKEAVKEKVNEVIIKDFLAELNSLEKMHVPPGLDAIEVLTISSLKDDIKKDIERIIKDKAGKDIPIKETVDEKVMGGITIKFGSLVLDGSISGKLKEASTAEKERIEKTT